jgi:hypothetical protein
MKRNMLMLGCVFGTFSAAVSCAAHAERFSSPFSDAIAAPLMQPVGDEVLARQTGKFAGVPAISGFVLSLLSQWQLPNGESLAATGTLAVSRTVNGFITQSNAGAVVQSLVNGNGQGVNTNANGVFNNGANGATTSGGENVRVNGVSQITQVAGYSNSGNNTAVIDFSPGNPGQLYNGNTQASANGPTGLAANIAFTSTGAMVSLNTPAGIATQQIITSQNQTGNIAQLLKIAGNNQAVTNQLQLHLQTSNLNSNQIRVIGVQSALANMTSIRK